MDLLHVPEKEGYVSRSISGVKDLDLFKTVANEPLLKKKNILLLGPTGTAKTSVWRQYCAVNKQNYVRVACATAFDPSSLFGRHVPIDGTRDFVWKDGIITSVVRNGGVLLLDEVNFLPAKVAATLFPLLDEDRQIVLMDNGGELVKAHKDLLIVGTMNPGYRGTADLNKAFDNRFGIKIEWGYSREVEKKLLKSSSLVEMAWKIRDQLNSSGTQTPLPTNALQDFENLVLAVGADFAVSNLVTRFYSEKEATQDAIKATIATYKNNVVRELTPQPKTKPKATKAQGSSKREFTNMWGMNVNGVTV